MDARPISHYAGLVRRELVGQPFAPAPGRLGWLVLHVAIAVAATFVIAAGRGGWPVAVSLALVIGNSFAVMAFVAHDALHGSIVRSPLGRRLVGWVGFLPLAVSPTHWVAWHNKAHHRHTMRAGVDPDAFPTLVDYRADALVRFGDELTFGAGRLRGLVGLIIGFSAQSFSVLFLLARQRRLLSPKGFAVALAETSAAVVFWVAVALFLGPWAFLFSFVVPMMVANAIVMAYIMSNHSLSPLTDVNDPLLNSLSVTTPRLLEILHLGFGMHVEHHIFPSMSPRFAGQVRRSLQAQFPGRYQTMSLGRALIRVFRTAHVYKDATTLIDPRTLREWPALAPGALTPGPAAGA